MPRPPLIVTTPEAVMDATLGAMTIGALPVLGGFHAGHADIIRRSVAENDETIVAMLDLNAPVPDHAVRDAHEAGARIIYKPDPETMFPPGASTLVEVSGNGPHWQRSRRPEQSGRVATLVAVLLNQLQPTRTYVGEKDWGQLKTFQRMHADLALSGEMIACPIVRDPDGLPLSTYNHLLSDDQRRAAAVVSGALFDIQRAALIGETQAATLLARAKAAIEAEPMVALTQMAIVDPETLEDVNTVTTGDRALVTASIGDLRIVDNVHLVMGS